MHTIVPSPSTIAPVKGFSPGTSMTAAMQLQHNVSERDPESIFLSNVVEGSTRAATLGTVRMPVCSLCKKSANLVQNIEENVTFHKFPLSRPTILQEWKRVCGMESADAVRGKYICSRHFAPADLIINKFRTVLAKTAIPHSYYHYPLQTRFQLPVPPPQQSVLDEHSVAGWQETSGTISPVPGPSGLQEHSVAGWQETSGTISPVPGPSGLQDATNELSIFNPLAESSVTPVKDSKRGGILSTIGETRVKNLTPRKLKLFKTLQEKKLKVKYLQGRVTALREKSNIQRRKGLNALADEVGSFISPHFYDLLKGQLSNTSKFPSGRRWSVDVKVLCLALRRRSLQAYKLLAKLMLLPSPRTLLLLSNKIPFHVGLSNALLDHLQNLGKTMPQNSKLCSLIFDEMSIRKHLSFNVVQNYIFGYEDLGNIRRYQYADHALVFMLRGIVDNWKQPISYYLIHGSASAADLEIIIVNVIKAVQATGFSILALISDRAAANVHALRTLALKTCSWDRPILEINGQRIVIIADPPHLLKSTRNALLKNSITYLSNSGKEETAYWSHLLDAFKTDKNKSFRTMGKITADHLEPTNKMKVKLASQALSQTVALALLLYKSESGVDGAEHLAELIFDVNHLFDSFNGSDKFNDSAYYRQPFTESSPHLQFWEIIEKKLATWKFVGLDGKPSRIKVQEAWRKNIDAVRTLWKMLRDLGVTSVMTRHLNQDPLENFFGVVRQHGVRNNNPTCQQFDLAFKSAILNGMIGVNNKFNCENDEADILSNLRKFVSLAEANERVSESCADTCTSYMKGYKEVQESCAWTLSLPPFTTDPSLIEQASATAHVILKKIPLLKSCHSCLVSVIECTHSPPSDGCSISCTCSQPVLPLIISVWNISVLFLGFLREKGHVPKLLEALQNSIENFKIEQFGCQSHKKDLQNSLKVLLSRTVTERFCQRVSSILKNTK